MCIEDEIKAWKAIEKNANTNMETIKNLERLWERTIEIATVLNELAEKTSTLNKQLRLLNKSTFDNHEKLEGRLATLESWVGPKK